VLFKSNAIALIVDFNYKIYFLFARITCLFTSMRKESPRRHHKQINFCYLVSWQIWPDFMFTALEFYKRFIEIDVRRMSRQLSSVSRTLARETR